MTDDTRTTFEEAKLCPKCKRAGEVRKSFKAENARGKMVDVHLVYCTTELCPWFGSPWVVQVNDDGTIPQPYSQLGDKQYPKLSQESVSRVEDNIRRQLQAETEQGGHGELRNPYG